MLSDPFERRKLFDLLRPPEGFELDEAIGSTYSLDLPALLVAPLAFTLFDAEDRDGHVRMQSLELLESLRRYAKKLTVFCHAGRIVSPAVRFSQFVYLEDVIVQCLPGNGASFHPKVWVLRYIGPENAVIYRMLCLTRNLTFDRSWDSALAIEGPLIDRKKEFARNRPLADFVAALPSLAREGVSESVSARIQRLAAEVRRVAFALPPDVDEMKFWPLGIEDYKRRPFDVAGSRMLVMSPFLSKAFLNDLVRERSGCVLISSPMAINELGLRPPGVEHVYTLADAATPEPESADDGEHALESVASGLHVKCYVMADGRSARVLTGSANATRSGFQRNVEFLVELEGPRKLFGIDALLSRESGATRLADLLVEVTEFSECDVDEQAAEIEERIERVRSAIVAATLRFRCEPSSGLDCYFDVMVEVEVPVAFTDDVEITCWPVTLGEDRAAPLNLSGSTATTFKSLTSLALSRFLNVQLTAGDGALRSSVRFVLSLPLLGGPVDREEQVLRSMLSDRRQLIRYLLLLIADETSMGGEALLYPDLDRNASCEGQGSFVTPALLESFLRALDCAPERLDHVHRLVSDLRATEEGRQLLPPEFDAIWIPVWQARERGRPCAR
jgi:hypothetical protein